MGGLAKFGFDIAKNVFNVAYQASGCLIRSIALLGLLYLLAQVRMDRIAEDCAVLDRPRYAPSSPASSATSPRATAASATRPPPAPAKPKSPRWNPVRTFPSKIRPPARYGLFEGFTLPPPLSRPRDA